MTSRISPHSSTSTMVPRCVGTTKASDLGHIVRERQNDLKKNNPEWKIIKKYASKCLKLNIKANLLGQLSIFGLAYHTYLYNCFLWFYNSNADGGCSRRATAVHKSSCRLLSQCCSRCIWVQLCYTSCITQTLMCWTSQINTLCRYVSPNCITNESF